MPGWEVGVNARVVCGVAVDTVVAMHDVDTFEDDVSAYPAVVLIRASEQGQAKLLTRTAALAKELRWKLSAGLGNRHLPPLQDERSGTRVGMGLATGCDEVSITKDPDLVACDRLVPLLQAGQFGDGEPKWDGTYLVNPWVGRGLVDLDGYPMLRDYFEANGLRLRARHVAKKRPNSWYRTIDRVTPGLLRRPKLVMPDMKSAAHLVLDEGNFYPCHNLYCVVSDTSDSTA